MLLTGGTGFVGSHVVKRLIADGHEVILLRRKTSSMERLPATPQLLSYDIERSMLDAFDKVDAVIHLATEYHKVSYDYQTMAAMNESNVIMPQKILELAIAHGVRYFINTGSFFEFKQSGEPLTEFSIKEPYNYYGLTKIMFDEILKFRARQKKIRTMTLRLFPVYGPKDQPNKLFPMIIDSLSRTRTIDVSPCKQEWSYVYVEDVAEAYSLALKALKTLRRHYYDFNIGTNEPIEMEHIVRRLGQELGKPELIKFGGRRYSDNEIMHVSCNPLMAEIYLGWKAKTDIDTGIQKTVSKHTE